MNLFAAALFVREALDWDIYTAVALVLAMTAICTICGGLTAVIYTDTLQAALMLIGASGLAALALHRVGGYPGLMRRYPTAPDQSPDHSLHYHNSSSNATCVSSSPDAFRMLRGITDADYPWLGFLLGQTPASIWYLGTDQMMVQRAMAARSLSHAQGATLFCAALKILPLFIMVLPGMAARVLYPDPVGCVHDCHTRCGNPVSCSNLAFPTLVTRLLPPGLRGAMLAVMLAALVSGLTSIFNSASTLFTIDIWARLRPHASTREKLGVGRLWVLAMVLFSLAWVPIVERQQGGQLYIYVQVVCADLTPPIAAVFLIAVLWRRASEQGAFWGLMTGLAVGATRLLCDFLWIAPSCGQPDLRPPILASLHYMYFALLLFWLTVAVTVLVSLKTAPDPKFRVPLSSSHFSFQLPPSFMFQIIRTTYWTRHDDQLREDETSLGMDAQTMEMEIEKEESPQCATSKCPGSLEAFFCPSEATSRANQIAENVF